VEERKLSRERIANIVSDFLDGKRGNIEHIEIDGGIGGLRKLYIIPIGTHHGRGEIIPNVIRAQLVTPDGKRSFGTVAIKHYRTAVKDEDAVTLLPPTVAQGKILEGPEKREVFGKKLAVQKWMPDASAEEYLMEVAKILHMWEHLIRKKPEIAEKVTISDVAPQNIKKWAVDLDVYDKSNAKYWDSVALSEFLDEYGENAKKALEKLAKVAKLDEDEIKTIMSAAERKKVNRKFMEIMGKMWRELPKHREFWEHHVKKDMEILEEVRRMAKIPEERVELLKRTAKWLAENGHKNYPESLLQLAELERNIVAEWVSAYKRAIEGWEDAHKE